MLKGFDESLQMNVFTLNAAGGIICLLCSKPPAVTTSRGKKVIFTLPRLPGLHAQIAWIIIAALINTKKSIILKKLKAFDYFMLFITVAFQTKSTR